METRKSSGLEIFPDKGAAKKILKWLRQGKVVGLTVDQRTSPAQGGIRVDFLRQPVWTTTAPAKLALASGAALLPVRLERRPDGDHDLIIEREIPLIGKEDGESNRRLAEKYNEILGVWVTHRPEQWMWLHRRFRQYKTVEQT
jgi:KDO2-lipid IV(A) lauroyltransferase